MSIAPPSDIILDVAQAADPQRLQAATTKLNAMATEAGGAPADFASLLDRAAAKPPTAPQNLTSTLVRTTPGATQPANSPYRKFEAVLLQTFIQEMLPKDENLFGDAASADVCRSMLAEQLATQLSKTGAFGIAKMVAKAEAAKHAAMSGGAPAPAPVPATVPNPT